MRNSLYDQIGGEQAISAAVSLFYRKMMEDDMLAPFFDGMKLDEIKAHQRSFFTALLGQKVDYTGRELRDAHKDLVHKKGLTDEHFNRTALHLSDTFKELGVDSQLASELIKIVDSMRGEVLDR